MGNCKSLPKTWCSCSCCTKCCKHKATEEIRLNPLILPPILDETDATSTNVISIKSFDLCTNENGPDHHTKNFYSMKSNPGDETKLIVRRGQPFKIRLTTNRPFSRARDTLNFVFTLHNDEKPSHGHGTLVGCMLKSNSYELGESNEWGSAIETISGDQMDVLIKPSCRAPIGEWRVEIDTQVSNQEGVRNFKYSSTFYVLFNPWCKDDQVYMPDREALREYVLADTTLIWRGSYNRLRPSVWKLGQYERDVLDCSLLLMSKIGKVTPAHRGDPIKISRALSAAVNSPDDDGAVLGNWSEDFSGGTPPTKWIGSVAILQEYYKKRKPVKFGQCWVFSGVLTTIARTLGIPSRIITNYSSAHDTQGSLTVDYFVDAEGKVLEEMNSDSIWNYHVWNEVWMDRPDIGVEYGGWQAIDSTPQEMSDDMYRCGPASVLAVKLGEILRPYDCDFLYSEVNADKVFWRYTGPYQPLKLLRKDTLGIGHLISTKQIGQWDRDDITKTYKFAEKSRDERDTMAKALKQANSSFSRYYLNEDFNDIYFDFNLQDDIKIGETFQVTLQVKNRSDEKAYDVVGSLHVETVLYTGKQRDKVKSTTFDINIPPNSLKLIEMEVTFDEYFGKLMDQAAFNISCMANVRDTDYEYFAQDDFRVRKPDIKITFQGIPTSHEEIDVIVRLTNPLPIPLRKGLFQLEGPGIESQILKKIAEVPVSATTSATFKYTPPFAGRAALVAKFSCKELDDVDGFLAYEVRPRPDDVLIESNEINGGYNRRIERRDVIP
ncbi:annulin isoform X2 [Bradysia coprophila]|uniref:annulin isoform X2 n=1 Tax=Bradysia coprophila TaxID=38358 RepID=UPI00187D9643|nr:annulin isoform X2 [Bradysia coprophila]XP_037037695.1 annulin isoform X2 [Bradysia coprophila]